MLTNKVVSPKSNKCISKAETNLLLDVSGLYNLFEKGYDGYGLSEEEKEILMCVIVCIC